LKFSHLARRSRRELMELIFEYLELSDASQEGHPGFRDQADIELASIRSVRASYNIRVA